MKDQESGHGVGDLTLGQANSACENSEIIALKSKLITVRYFLTMATIRPDFKHQQIDSNENCMKLVGDAAWMTGLSSSRPRFCVINCMVVASHNPHGSHN